MFYVLFSGLLFSILALFLVILSILVHFMQRKEEKLIGKGTLITSFLISIFSLIALFGIFVVSQNPPRTSSPEWNMKTGVESAMSQLRTEAAMYFDTYDSYIGLEKYPPVIHSIENIKQNKGTNFGIHI